MKLPAYFQQQVDAAPSRQRPAEVAAQLGEARYTRDRTDLTVLESSKTCLRFVIHGTPMGAPRMTRRDKWAGRACVTRYMAWRNKLEALRLKLPNATHVKSLSWVAYFEPPGTLDKKKLTKADKAALLGERHCAKPDRDNIDKALLDGLFPAEDKAIAAGGLCKVWGSPARTEVEIVFE